MIQVFVGYGNNIYKSCKVVWLLLNCLYWCFWGWGRGNFHKKQQKQKNNTQLVNNQWKACERQKPSSCPQYPTEGFSSCPRYPTERSSSSAVGGKVQMGSSLSTFRDWGTSKCLARLVCYTDFTENSHGNDWDRIISKDVSKDCVSTGIFTVKQCGNASMVMWSSSHDTNYCI